MQVMQDWEEESFDFRRIRDNTPELAGLLDLLGWRQSKFFRKKAKQAAREIGRIKKGANYQDRLKTAYGKLLQITDLILPRTQGVLDDVWKNVLTDGVGRPADEAAFLLEELVYRHAVTTHVCGTARLAIV